ncbi:MAG: TonB-dependent receptor, partial [Candidatus Aminicenantes bacterium]|nr:TonB-dependent receptor [Candidatus Aminicenantes bacterium]
SAAYLPTKNDVFRFSAGVYHQYGDYYLLDRNPDLKPKAAVHYALSYDRIMDDMELRATAYDKEYRDLYLNGADGSAGNGGFGFARGAELFVKKKSPRSEFILVYNFLRSRRKENDLPSPAPSPYEIAHSATAILTRTIGKTEVGLRYSIASGRPCTPLVGREWDPADQVYSPIWGEPYSDRYPVYSRLDLTGNTRFTLWNRLVVLYFGLTNVLNNKNILRYDYGDDYAGRKDQQSIFGRSLFLGIYIPFF